MSMQVFWDDILQLIVSKVFHRWSQLPIQSSSNHEISPKPLENRPIRKTTWHLLLLQTCFCLYVLEYLFHRARFDMIFNISSILVKSKYWKADDFLRLFLHSCLVEWCLVYLICKIFLFYNGVELIIRDSLQSMKRIWKVSFENFLFVGDETNEIVRKRQNMWTSAGYSLLHIQSSL